MTWAYVVDSDPRSRCRDWPAPACTHSIQKAADTNVPTASNVEAIEQVVRLNSSDVLLGILMDGGLSPERSVVAMNVVVACVRGAVGVQASHELEPPHHEEFSADEMAALTPEAYPHLLKATAAAPELDFDEWFDYGMRALARGFFEA